MVAGASSIVLPGIITTRRVSFEVALFAVQIPDDRDFLGVFTTRRVSEGQTREELERDVTSSLAYASGWDKIEERNVEASASQDEWLDLMGKLHLAIKPA